MAESFQKWIREQLRARTGYDAMARALLTALGDSHDNGAAAFQRMAAGPREQAERVSEIFMGARLRCANCHNHPLDHWTQDDYHGLAAVFARVERGRVVALRSRGDVTHPVTGEPAVARIPGTRFIAESADPRVELAKWLTGADEEGRANPYFAKACVNRIWRALMGRGLVDPVDDVRATNPPSHPELLDKLAAAFVKSRYDLRHVIRLIATSAAFARGGVAEASSAAGRFYARRIALTLPAEVLADAISDATGVAEQFGEEPLGTRAIALAYPGIPSRSLDLLGRCDRAEPCDSTTAAGGLATKLHLLNGAFLNRRVSSPDGRLHRLIDAGRSTSDIVEDFFIAAIGRRPRDAERRFWKRALDREGKERTELLEDFVWSLLGCEEFKTMH